jgi:hypothetical protein
MTSTLTKYRPSTSTRRLRPFLKSTATAVLVLPPYSVPIDPPKNYPRHWLLPMEVGSTAFPPPRTILPATTFADRIAALDSSLQALVTNAVLLIPLPEIFTLLRLLYPIMVPPSGLTLDRIALKATQWCPLSLQSLSCWPPCLSPNRADFLSITKVW